jgi:hypothetical protein
MTIIALCQWLTPVILITWEAEIRRIAAPNQPRLKTFVTLYLNGKNAGPGVEYLSPQVK